nr:hypothetical protein [Desulfobacula sp.]
MRPAREYFESISSDLNCAENHLVSGLIAREQRDKPRALGLIRRGLEIASREGYVFFPLISGRIMVRAFVTGAAFGGDFPGEALMRSPGSERGRPGGNGGNGPDPLIGQTRGKGEGGRKPETPV